MKLSEKNLSESVFSRKQSSGIVCGKKSEAQEVHRGGNSLKAGSRAFSVALLVLGLPCQAVAGTEILCADADGEISFSYSTDKDAAQPIRNVEMQLTDDFGLSTDPAHPNHSGEYIAHGFIVEDMQGADLLWPNADGNELQVMSFRIGKVFEARQARIGGVVSVAGGGLWTVTCQAVEEET